tara:strand:+ start:1606 stop:2493 length:888 start_codon:yes stop_codon:yes gene_type:complete
MNRVFIITSYLFLSFSTIAQEDLLLMLDENTETLTYATFKSKKIINLQSVEQSSKNELDFVISHRFGPLNSGYSELYGLDVGTMRMILDYGLTENISISLARSSSEKIIDASVKYRLLTQGFKNSPITISSYSSIFYDTLAVKWWAVDSITSNKNIGFQQQILIATKVNSNLSLQLSPIYTNYYKCNQQDFTAKKINSWALGIGSRYKINRGVSINTEWVPVIMNDSYIVHPFKNKDIINSFSIGVDIETGGHVFQLFATNSSRMSDKGFVNQNEDKWNEGGVYFGFNIARTFNL